MKSIPALLAATLSIGCLLSGCRPAKVQSPPHEIEVPATRNNCYSLLHQLLDDEKDVSMLRFIKREHSDVKDLVKKIAATSGTELKVLEKLAKNDPSVDLDATDLPSGEIATRKAIASTKKEELLSQTGEAFELTLLLSQAEALNYAWHLSQVASENDPQPDRAHLLAEISGNMKNLYQEVFTLLLSKTKSPATNQ